MERSASTATPFASTCQPPGEDPTPLPTVPEDCALLVESDNLCGHLMIASARP